MDNILKKLAHKTKYCVFLILYFCFIISCAPKNPIKTPTPKIDIPYIEAQLDSQIQMYDTLHTKCYKKTALYSEVNRFNLTGNNRTLLLNYIIGDIGGDYSSILKLNNIDVYGDNLVVDDFTIVQNVYLLHNKTTNKIYFWLPFEWANYVSLLDTNIIKVNDCKYSLSMSAQIDTVLEPQYWGLGYSAKYPKFRTEEYFYYTISDTLSYLAYSLKQEHHFNTLQQIFEDISFIDKSKIDTLLQLLQSQYRTKIEKNNNCFSIVNVSDTNPTGLQFTPEDLRHLPIYKYTTWRCQKCPEIKEHISTEYLLISADKINSLQFILPDGYIENLDEIAEYAKRTKPAFIYYKPFARNYSSPYYYFIFYYIDFLPFMPPRLRDMQVVFPRRFGLS